MNRIKELRLEKSMYQKDLAKIMSVGQTTLSNWEKEYALPDFKQISKLAEFFDVSTDYLMGNSNIRTSYFDNKKGASKEEDFARRIAEELKKDPELAEGLLSDPEESEKFLEFILKNADLFKEFAERHRKQFDNEKRKDD